MPKEPFIIEICAGSARVTSCLQSLGLPTSFGVDHKRQRNAGRVLVADLTSLGVTGDTVQKTSKPRRAKNDGSGRYWARVSI